MVNQEILDYIKRELAKDFERDEIKQMLIAHGYPKEEVIECFDSLETEEPAGPKPDEQKRGPPRSVLFIIVGIIAVILVTYVVLSTLKAPGTDVPKQPEYKDHEDTYTIVNLSPLQRETFYKRFLESCTIEYAPKSDPACLALAGSDPSVCGSDSRCSDVYILYSVASRKMSDCSGVSDPSAKGACESLDSQNMCSDLKGDQLKTCEAVISADAALCARIRDDDTSRQCSDSVYLFSALKSSDESMCRKILYDAEMTNRCMGMITKNATACAWQRQCEDIARMEIAQMSNNIDDCQSIIDSATKSRCQDMFD
jgi:hypothetical protein